LIISETASDPLDPAIRSTNQLALSQLVPNNRQISLRNLHVIDATSPAGGASQGMEPMNVSNMSRELKYVELTISRVDFGKDAVVGLLLPTTRQVTVKGAVLARAQLNAMQRRTAEGLKLNPDAFYRVTDTREATLLLPIPPGQTWQVGIVYDRGKTNRMTSPQLSVMARQGDRVIGGNTYVFRPQSRIRK
jgi:hypothetical protein